LEGSTQLAMSSRALAGLRRVAFPRLANSLALVGVGAGAAAALRAPRAEPSAAEGGAQQQQQQQQRLRELARATEQAVAALEEYRRKEALVAATNAAADALENKAAVASAAPAGLSAESAEPEEQVHSMQARARRKQSLAGPKSRSSASGPEPPPAAAAPQDGDADAPENKAAVASAAPVGLSAESAEPEEQVHSMQARARRKQALGRKSPSSTQTEGDEASVTTEEGQAQAASKIIETLQTAEASDVLSVLAQAEQEDTRVAAAEGAARMDAEEEATAVAAEPAEEEEEAPMTQAAAMSSLEVVEAQPSAAPVHSAAPPSPPSRAPAASTPLTCVEQYWVKGSEKPTLLATELSQSSGLRGLQPDELAQVFSTVDSSSLTKVALLQALPDADPAAVGRLFDVFGRDADGDGVDDIDYRTFVCAAAIMADAKPASKLKLFFLLCDDDAGGAWRQRHHHILPPASPSICVSHVACCLYCRTTRVSSAANRRAFLCVRVIWTHAIAYMRRLTRPRRAERHTRRVALRGLISRAKSAQRRYGGKVSCRARRLCAGRGWSVPSPIPVLCVWAVPSQLSLTKPWTWRGADVDHSGAITREEFVTWVAAGSGLAEFLSQSLLMFLNPRSSRR
jgi:hypothetical protein